MNENLLFGFGSSGENESMGCGSLDTQRFEVTQKLRIENQSLHPVLAGQVTVKVQIKTVLRESFDSGNTVQEIRDAQIIVAQNPIQANQWFAEEPQIQPQNNDNQFFGPQNPVPQPFLNETNGGSYVVSNAFASLIQTNNSTNLYSGTTNVNPWANSHSDNNNNQFHPPPTSLNQWNQPQQGPPFPTNNDTPIIQQNPHFTPNQTLYPQQPQPQNFISPFPNPQQPQENPLLWQNSWNQYQQQAQPTLNNQWPQTRNQNAFNNNNNNSSGAFTVPGSNVKFFFLKKTKNLGTNPTVTNSKILSRWTGDLATVAEDLMGEDQCSV